MDGVKGRYQPGWNDLDRGHVTEHMPRASSRIGIVTKSVSKQPHHCKTSATATVLLVGC